MRHRKVGLYIERVIQYPSKQIQLGKYLDLSFSHIITFFFANYIFCLIF